MRKVDVVGDLREELASLQPALEDLERVSTFEDALRTALQVESDYRNNHERPTHSNQPDYKAIELNGESQRARDALSKVNSEGRQAQRRVAEINALLNAGDDVVRIGKQIATQRAARKAATEKAEKATALINEIRDQLIALERERTAAIDRGVEERLDGRSDTSAKVVSLLDAKLTSARDALAGAERVRANVMAELERAENLSELDGKLRSAMRFRGKLAWEQAKADLGFNRAAAKYLASLAIAFAGEDHVELRPPREMLDEEVAALKTELSGTA